MARQDSRTFEKTYDTTHRIMVADEVNGAQINAAIESLAKKHGWVMVASRTGQVVPPETKEEKKE